MKRYLCFIAVAFIALGMTGCKKDYPGDSYDFSNRLTPYVELSSLAAITIKEGASKNVTFQMKTSLQQPVTIRYDITGAINKPNQTATIDRNKLNVVVPVAVPAGTIVPPATSATATLTLKSATLQDGTVLTIGSKNVPSLQKITINITP